jgi:hypothetical protein
MYPLIDHLVLVEMKPVFAAGVLIPVAVSAPNSLFLTAFGSMQRSRILSSRYQLSFSLGR